MALTAPTRAAAWIDAGTQAAQDLRLNTVAAFLSELGGAATSPLAVASGVRQSTGNPLQVQLGAGLGVTVNTGIAVVQGSASANAGAYSVALDTVGTLTCTAADPVNPRVDAVCITADTQVVQIITGTPASLPASPTLPANSLLLCNITVPAAATTLIGANLSDQRQFLAGVGGIKPFLKQSLWPAATGATSSDYLHDIATGRMKRWNGSAWVAPSTVGFAPAYGTEGTVIATGTVETVSSVSVTVDGSTAVRLHFAWTGFTTAGTGAGTGCTIALERGSTNLYNVYKYCTGADSSIDGGSFTFPDQTPAAGTYTYSVTLVNQGAGTFKIYFGLLWAEAIPS